MIEIGDDKHGLLRLIYRVSAVCGISRYATRVEPSNLSRLKPDVTGPQVVMCIAARARGRERTRILT